MNLIETAKLVRDKQVSPVELVQDLLADIERRNDELNAFVTLDPESVLQAARTAEQQISTGSYLGPLHGIPLGIKDIIYTRGMRTTMGSKVYENFVPEENAAVVERIYDGGGIVLGKLNTHEFAYGPTGDRSLFGPARNPHNPVKMTGGSSSGSGAAVAAGLCYGALGSDTGGSVRIPSACCGIVGMKPTFGRVSKRGVYPLSYSLDHVGPMTRTVMDNAVMLGVLAGYDEQDPYSTPMKTEDFTRYLTEKIHNAKIGVPTSYFNEQLDPEVSDAFQAAQKVFESLGAVLVPVNLPDMNRFVEGQQLVQKSEAYAVHEDILNHRAALLDDEVRERLLASAEPRGYEYFKAMRFRPQATQMLDSVFDDVDVLITPTLPILPPDINQREIVIQGQPEPVRGALLRFTAPFNYTGNPCLSVPCGTSKSGLPIGLQLVGRSHSEAKLYRFAYWFEQNR
ncbi:amidase [Alicyclobacillus tolerans]|uniref:amidase n=1 Tax=Alicyclobacillus tolerans TaxID=90970 RepID=UPI001F314632|nr:amidase [Alicyclobacillus tolerans]MCF8564080.1 amidase [Alicyclobacillus tolerans]